MTVIPDTDFGARVCSRLCEEEIVWLTTTSDNGTPQPNPVWFLWEEDSDSVLVYNANAAARLAHVAVRPRVALNFNSAANGGDVVVIAGVAESAPDAPPADEHATYLAKYDAGIKRNGWDYEGFARDYSVPLRIRITKLRGF